MTQRILFVCLGNICRSPSAEAVARRMAAERGVSVEFDSAGTGDWHVGQPPYGPMQAAAKARGYDLSGLRARQVMARDFDRFDMIVVMDAQNKADVEALRPGMGGARVAAFTDYADEAGVTEVPDPYFTRDFDAALDLVERCAAGMLDTLGR
ncbi:low molecular weight protein-tyrosine-phosphatase [Citreimonas sp.]|uniref:low molecular weight protein-tyrosine-phosphatase n=1 Tax=Citreimonas sp. TaxID=3036715 RepID=UPI0040584806